MRTEAGVGGARRWLCWLRCYDDHMKRITAEQAQNNLEKVIEEASPAQEPVRIDGTHEQGVLVALADWNAIQETLFLVSIPGMRESILEAVAEPLDSCSDALDW